MPAFLVHLIDQALQAAERAVLAVAGKAEL